MSANTTGRTRPPANAQSIRIPADDPEPAASGAPDPETPMPAGEGPVVVPYRPGAQGIGEGPHIDDPEDDGAETEET
jgi:hypothetical protein